MYNIFRGYVRINFACWKNHVSPFPLVLGPVVGSILVMARKLRLIRLDRCHRRNEREGIVSPEKEGTRSASQSNPQSQASASAPCYAHALARLLKKISIQHNWQTISLFQGHCFEPSASKIHSTLSQIPSNAQWQCSTSSPIPPLKNILEAITSQSTSYYSVASRPSVHYSGLRTQLHPHRSRGRGHLP
jgi:hypothetical protein